MRPFSSYLAQIIRNPSTRLSHPVLLWRCAPTDKPPIVWSTNPLGPLRPKRGAPVVFEVRSRPEKSRPSSPGITLGRSDLNDLAVEDPSISIVHAYFQETRSATGDPEWRVFDAASRNGTTLNGRTLVGQVLQDGDCLTVGGVDLLFYSPEAFRELLLESTQTRTEAR